MNLAYLKQLFVTRKARKSRNVPAFWGLVDCGCGGADDATAAALAGGIPPPRPDPFEPLCGAAVDAEERLW